MQVRDDRSRYSFRGVQFEQRVWDDPQGRQKPIFIIEETPESQKSLLAGDREALARAMTERIGFQPDKVIWLEQDSKGDLTRYDFVYSHTQRIVPQAGDMDASEAVRIAEQGKINSVEIRHYDAKPHAVSAEELRQLRATTENALVGGRELRRSDPAQEPRQSADSAPSPRAVSDHNKAQEAQLGSARLPKTSASASEIARLSRNEPEIKM